MFQRLVALAWSQQGALSTPQAADCGVHASTLSRCARDGRLVRRRPSVYVLPAAPQTWRQDLVVEVLASGPGALATGDSALAVWCPELEPPGRPVVTTPAGAGRRSSRACRVINSTDLDLAKPGVVDGVPVVGVARALLDSAIDASPDAVVARIGACQRHLPMSFGALVEALHALARRGRPGIATFRKAIASMSAEVPDSEFERLVLRDFARTGLPKPELHHVVHLPGEDAIELDLAWNPWKIDLELDGRDHLTRMKTARRDRQRDRALGRNGWTIPRFTWPDYVEDPAGPVREVKALLRARGFSVS